MELIHPKARSGGGSAPYYAFNATDEEGNISVEFIQNLLGAISAVGVQAFSPLLIQRNIDSGVAVNAEDRIIEDAECLGISSRIFMC